MIYLLVVCGITLFVIHYVGQRTIVEGASMEPNLSDGDNLVVDKLSYVFSEPERFDIIVFPDQAKPDERFIKRVIGLPGETVRIDTQGYIYINGEKLEESYGREVMKTPGLAAEELELGEEEYFVLGDNRNDSLDSRDIRVGMVNRQDIIGRAWLRIYPFDKIGKIKR